MLICIYCIFCAVRLQSGKLSMYPLSKACKKKKPTQTQSFVIIKKIARIQYTVSGCFSIIRKRKKKN